MSEMRASGVEKKERLHTPEFPTPLGGVKVVERAAVEKVRCVCAEAIKRETGRATESDSLQRVSRAVEKVNDVAVKAVEKAREVSVKAVEVAAVVAPGGQAVAAPAMAEQLVKQAAKTAAKELGKLAVKEFSGQAIEATESDSLQKLKPQVQTLSEATVTAKGGEVPTAKDSRWKTSFSADREDRVDTGMEGVAHGGIGAITERFSARLWGRPTEVDELILRSFVNKDGLTKFVPHKDGLWDGEEGNSVWRPDRSTVPEKLNKEGKTWGEILDENGIDGIPFVDGEADFSAASRGTVTVDGFSVNRDPVYIKDADGNRVLVDEGNFSRADKALAEQWNLEGRDGRTDWTYEDVQDFRRGDNPTGTKYSWHECGDQKTMMLVDQTLHINVPHSGGISAAKQSV